MTRSGLFIGLITLDLIYEAPYFPKENEKITASRYTIAAGGPATNSAITFAGLNNNSTLWGVLGCHPFSKLVESELRDHHLKVRDLDPSWSEPLAISSIITQPTGDRAVISINAQKNQVGEERDFTAELENFDFVFIDGHQMKISQAIAHQAKAYNLPVIVDGGSWKPGFDTVLSQTDYAICSANFYPPGCQTTSEVFRYLEHLGIAHIAITQGEKPISYRIHGKDGECPVPAIQAVDTLGAGDIFHGAFCHYILQEDFSEALAKAAEIAAYSCQFFGTREWMKKGYKSL